MSWFVTGSVYFMTIFAFESGMSFAAESTTSPDKSKPDTDPATIRLTINIYNQAGVEDTILQKALKQAGRIFEEQGISTEWFDCPLTPIQLAGSPTCLQAGFSVISLRIFPRLEPIQGRFRRTHMGVAMVEEQGRVYASVFYQRVVDVADSEKISTGKVLGHAMAHEIGHLLLGSNSHSPAGLMKANWNNGDLKLLDVGRLHFSPREGYAMRAEVASRNSQARSQMPSTAR